MNQVLVKTLQINYNPEQNIWQKVAKAGKIGQDQSGIKAGH